MKFDCSEEIQRKLAFNILNKFFIDEKLIELKEVKKTRSNKLNAALHLYFNFISKELNDLGLTFSYIGIKKIQIDIPYTPELVKECIWRKIQITLFNIKSTKKLDAKQINIILKVLNKFFEERGIIIEFPNFQSLKHKLDLKSNIV